MSPDISLLPEDLRREEEELKSQRRPSHAAEAPLAMHLPSQEQEDVEVIEIDEGDVRDVLANEPWLSRAVFGVQAFFQKARASLFQPRATQPPPKLPPQFFKPPTKATATGLIPINGAKPSTTPTPAPAKPKARVVPAAEAPRRVRVIKRVRKPVRVSFLDEAEWQMMADVPRRKFTLVMTLCVFLILLGGGYVLLLRQGERSLASLAEVQSRLAIIQNDTTATQAQWKSYSDLEPRLKQLGSLLNAHLAPTALFDALEQATVPSVYYTGMSLAPNGTVTLSASAPSFEDAAKQIVALRSAGLASKVDAFGYHADYAGTSNDVERVTFQISMTLNRAFLNAATRVAKTPSTP